VSETDLLLVYLYQGVGAVSWHLVEHVFCVEKDQGTANLFELQRSPD
jgi:hypothetical protein